MPGDPNNRENRPSRTLSTSLGGIMRRKWFLLVLVLGGTSGCTVGRLRQRTLNQGGTVPDLQYPASPRQPGALRQQPRRAPVARQPQGRHGADHRLDRRRGDRRPGSTRLDPPATLQVADRRAAGVGELPDAEFLDELAHELKGQHSPNNDLQDESALFHGLQARANPTLRDFATRVVTTTTPDMIGRGDLPVEEVSPLARDIRREVESVARALSRIQPGWYHTGGRHDVPRDACSVGRNGRCFVWVNADGCEQLTEFTLTVLKFANLIREVPSLTSAGSVKFSPGDRGG